MAKRLSTYLTSVPSPGASPPQPVKGLQTHQLIRLRWGTMACHVIHDVTVGDSLRQDWRFLKRFFAHLPPSHTNDVWPYEINTVKINRFYINVNFVRIRSNEEGIKWATTKKRQIGQNQTH